MEWIKAGRAIVFLDKIVPSAHLTLVLTDPDPEDGKVIIVSVVTKTEVSETTVLLAPGDHEFIIRDSSVLYDTARWCPSSKLEAAIRRNAHLLKADLRPAILAKVRAGLLVSSYTIHEVADYCRAIWKPD